MVPVATGSQPISLRWLWYPHNWHRVPLPKLCLAVIYRATKCNFIAPMYVKSPFWRRPRWLYR